ncbi:hypothetical protein Moror_17002 [Moniliophthora roreri MCA 2997]|uniref:Uncharacterized protein n=1 Tax=Moniliophthora roreri (strain MCA 2997) TaxID=1381753 RepID=V2WBJ7_MONRO|nr:hypothetical protein Moror_17002 [Moniliophthora roreri MCA 2997]
MPRIPSQKTLSAYRYHPYMLFSIPSRGISSYPPAQQQAQHKETMQIVALWEFERQEMDQRQRRRQYRQHRAHIRQFHHFVLKMVLGVILLALIAVGGM